MKQTIARLIGLFITIIIAIGFYYFALPALSIHSSGMWMFILVNLCFGIIIQVILDTIYKPLNKVFTKSLIIILGIIVSIFLIGALSSSHLINAKKYRDLVTIEEGNFEKDITSTDNISNISIVDMQTAQRVGDRTVGIISNSTWYEVNDEYNLIRYQGNLYRISALEYGGFFKYQKAKNEGIPGYVLVNTSTQEAKFIELKDKIKYCPSSYWSYDLRRHLRKQYPTYIFGESFFEIDDVGTPYYITSVKTASIGLFGGKKENSFVITNACTGQSTEYLTYNLPEWVDHAYDLDYLTRVAQNNLQYVNGYWNSVFSQTDILNLSYIYRDENFDGYNTVITSNGEIVFYTGLTPASNSESNAGFILLNPRTGAIKKYNTSGAEEKSAQDSAESLVQDLKYTSTFPTVLNINGQPTYFMLLKDKAGLVQRYSLCNVENYTKVVQADSLEKSIKLYKEKIGMNSNKETETVSKKSVISEVYQSEIDGNTFYFFKLDDDENLYMSSIKNNSKQVMLKKGVQVSIEYTKSSEKDVFVVTKIEF